MTAVYVTADDELMTAMYVTVGDELMTTAYVTAEDELMTAVYVTSSPADSTMSPIRRLGFIWKFESSSTECPPRVRIDTRH